MRELRQLTEDEVPRKLNELYQELFNLRFQLAVRQLTDYSRIEAVRKDIARVKTYQRQIAAGMARAGSETSG